MNWNEVIIERNTIERDTLAKARAAVEAHHSSMKRYVSGPYQEGVHDGLVKALSILAALDALSPPTAQTPETR